MFHRLCFVVAFVSIIVCLLREVRSKEPDLWIISGQSNACGRAKLPGPRADDRVLHWDPRKEKFTLAQDPLPGMGTVGVGPWVAAAQQVTRGGIAVNTVGFASGGKPIGYWLPGRPGATGLMPRIERAGQGAQVFLWYQGESNTRNPEEVATYAAELKKLIARIRKQAGNEKMLAVIVQLGAYTREDDRNFPALREAQRQFVVDDGNALLIPALGRTLKDAVHLDNAGYQELGREIGRAVLHARHKQAEVNWPGPVLDDAVLSADGTSLVAHFAEVEKLAGATAADFAVVDGSGSTVVAVSAASSATLVRLKFARKLSLPAKLVYGHGNNPKASLVDEAGNRAPAVRVDIRAGGEPKDKPTAASNGAGR